MKRRCEVAHCYGRHYARGWCWAHWERWFRTGEEPLPYANVNRLPVLRHP